MIQKVDHDPIFNWWVKHVLRKKDQIFARVWRCVTTKYAKTTMKFSIYCQKTLDKALALDKKNGKTLCADAIEK